MPYIALVIEEFGQDLLKEYFPAIYPNVYGDHITIVFNPSPEDLQKWHFHIGPDDGAEFEIIGYVQDEFCQALLVEQDDGLFDEIEHPHITISMAEGIPPKYSKELIKKRGDKYVRVHLSLAGIIKYVY